MTTVGQDKNKTTYVHVWTQTGGVHDRCFQTEKKKGPNERTGQSSRKIQLSEKETAHLSDAQFKTLVIRMLREFIEYGNKHKGRKLH